MTKREKFQIVTIVLTFLSVVLYKTIENQLEKMDSAAGIPIIIAVGVVFFSSALGFLFSVTLELDLPGRFRCWKKKRRVERMQNRIIREGKF
jgi:hypothetical protein